MIRAGGWVPCYRVKKVSDLFQNLSITPRLCLLSISLSFFLSLPLFLSFPLSLSLFFSFTHTLSLLSLSRYLSISITFIHLFSLSIYLFSTFRKTHFIPDSLSLSISLFHSSISLPLFLLLLISKNCPKKALPISGSQDFLFQYFSLL